MNVEIAQRLAELRRTKGYSQEALANELGLSRQAVSKWERAESSPDTENLIALARLYGVSLDDLLSVGKDVEEDVAFENAERAEAKAAADEARLQAEQAAAQAAAAAEEERERSRAATAQAVAAATQASEAAAQAAQAAVQASEQAARNTAQAASAAAAGVVSGPTPPASGHLYGNNEGKPHHGRWRSFPYGICMIALFFIIVIFLDGDGAAALLVFFTIPIYRWVANIMDEAHEREERKERETTADAARDADAGSTADAAQPTDPTRPQGGR